MKLTCVALEPDGHMRPEDEAAALSGWRAGAGSHWIDVSGGRTEEVTAWLTGLGVDAELLELLHVGGDDTRIVPLADSVFVSYPVPAGKEGRPAAHFGLLLLERLLVTLHETPDGPTPLDELPLERLKIREGSPAGVLCALALVHAARLRRHVVALRSAGNGLADRMDADPNEVPLQEILALKRRVLDLGAVVDEQLAVLEVLKASHLAALPLSHLVDTLQVAIELTRATDRDIDRLDRRSSDLHERHELVQQERMNRRLGLLTVLSAIFMPLTLVAGIYGMNFEVMPELHWRYGYPVALSAMALIGAGLGWYFRTRWWKR